MNDDTAKYLWRVRTITGEKVLVEAMDAAEAIRLSGFPPESIARWYPFPIRRIMTDEEAEAQAARLIALNERNKERRKLRRKRPRKEAA